jgi:ubiquinone/menaquinone biosynthesis C-methylase UbiE
MDSSKKVPHKTSSKTSKKTSWGGVADWYDTYLEVTLDSYQAMVLAPNLLRVLALQKGECVIDIACGQGYFTRLFAETGATTVGTDISKELVAAAKNRSPRFSTSETTIKIKVQSHSELSPQISYHIAPAHQLLFAKDASFDAATIVLAIQNIENISETFTEAHRVLKPGGRLVLVMNHPAFRSPKRTSWGWDEEAKVQYRRVDGYLSGATIPIEMHPGQAKSTQTISYHRSLQDFFKALSKAGFVVTKLEEWISHKKSEKGPKQAAEDTARKEIPLFLMLEARKSS